MTISNSFFGVTMLRGITFSLTVSVFLLDEMIKEIITTVVTTQQAATAIADVRITEVCFKEEKNSRQ